MSLLWECGIALCARKKLNYSTCIKSSFCVCVPCLVCRIVGWKISAATPLQNTDRKSETFEGVFSKQLSERTYSQQRSSGQWFLCSRDSCFLLYSPASPSNSQIPWQNQVKLRKIHLFNLQLSKESWFPNTLNRRSAELPHLEPLNKGMVWYLSLKLVPLLACMLDGCFLTSDCHLCLPYQLPGVPILDKKYMPLVTLVS